ncbi:hypothetical protein NL676_007267 [Syzygium grande]|nr:hypothetical protein NL676_007267 [Syzygium grande]
MEVASFEVEPATANRKLGAQVAMDRATSSPPGHRGCKAQGKCGERPKNYRCEIGLQKAQLHTRRFEGDSVAHMRPCTIFAPVMR